VGKTFRRLRDEVQSELAGQLLRNAAMPAGADRLDLGLCAEQFVDAGFLLLDRRSPAEWRHR
jgi:hypothetical protein